jgi:2-polyprenyl-3-methyl-5-hydroxy-6-metoxy-1,4-benzoquinol methylase
VDLADDLLVIARAKAEQCGYTIVEFRTGDLLDLDLPEAGFDAVVCVFGIFFVPDMQAAALSRTDEFSILERGARSQRRPLQRRQPMGSNQ